MTTSYPGAVDNLTNPTPSDTLNSATVPHAAQHANLNDAMEAVQTVLGTNPQGTSSTVKDRIAAAEGAIINLGQDLDTRVPGETGSNAPTGTLPNGYVWVNTTDNSLKVWDGTTWVDPSNAGGGSTGPSWAVVSGGTVTEYTHPTYGLMSVHTFTGNGTLTVGTAGFAEVLLVGGANGGRNDSPYIAMGSAGDIRAGIHSLPSGSLAVTVGAAGPLNQGETNPGGLSKLDASGTPVVTTAVSGTGALGAGATAGAGANGNLGFPSSITGTAQTYGERNGAPRANRGDASTSGAIAGTAGVVIVAVKKP